MIPAEIILRSEGRHAIESGRMRQVRTSARLSQRELAWALGVTPACVSLWECGRRLPRGESAGRIARLLREIEAALAEQRNDGDGAA